MESKLLLILIFITFISSCEKDYIESNLKDNSKSKSILGGSLPIEILPLTKTRNIFVFSDNTSDILSFWESWKLVGTVSVNQKPHQAIIINKLGEHLLISLNDSTTFESWKAIEVLHKSVHFIHTSGLEYTLKN